MSCSKITNKGSLVSYQPIQQYFSYQSLDWYRNMLVSYRSKYWPGLYWQKLDIPVEKWNSDGIYTQKKKKKITCTAILIAHCYISDHYPASITHSQLLLPRILLHLSQHKCSLFSVYFSCFACI